MYLSVIHRSINYYIQIHFVKLVMGDKDYTRVPKCSYWKWLIMKSWNWLPRKGKYTEGCLEGGMCLTILVTVKEGKLPKTGRYGQFVQKWQGGHRNGSPSKTGVTFIQRGLSMICKITIVFLSIWTSLCCTVELALGGHPQDFMQRDWDWQDGQPNMGWS